MTVWVSTSKVSDMALYKFFSNVLSAARSSRSDGVSTLTATSIVPLTTLVSISLPSLALAVDDAASV